MLTKFSEELPKLGGEFSMCPTKRRQRLNEFINVENVGQFPRDMAHLINSFTSLNVVKPQLQLFSFLTRHRHGQSHSLIRFY
jgi:hypothetical protein